ncbi:MAG: hypothetical protein JW856_05820 [Dehalococcoidales bacterium]|nr:hypothetical protein [Dehalococcoidales bacterium]
MKSKRYLIFRIALLVQLCALLFALAGCGKVKEYTPIEYTGGDDYKTFTMQEGIAHFSFEYPADYEIAPQVIQLTLSKTTGQMISIAELDENKYPLKLIAVTLYSINKDLPNADAAAKKWKATFNGFLTQRRVVVSGIEGIEFIYSKITSSNIIPFAAWQAKSYLSVEVTPLDFERCVFISNGSTIFQIFTFCEEPFVEQVNNDFDHFLQTFRILD